MKYLAILTSALLLSACSASSQVDLAGTNGAGESAIISEVHVKEDVADWGTFYPYFTEDTHVLSYLASQWCRQPCKRRRYFICARLGLSRYYSRE